SDLKPLVAGAPATTLISLGGAFGGNRGARPIPPEKGVFPLDHMHLCDQEKKEYISYAHTNIIINLILCTY
ncbi:hypothetical protein M8C21_015633, partial [Ambrosia artemisiifolia]